MGGLAAVICELCGVLFLRAACVQRVGGWRIGAGWLLLVGACLAWRWVVGGWDKAIALALLSPCLVGLGVIAASADVNRKKIRPSKAKGTTHPPSRPSVCWRALVRVALAGPMACVAAVSLAAATALRAPWDEADRLVAAGFIAPIVWAICGVWATTDDKLGRVGLGFCAVIAVSIGLAKS